MLLESGELRRLAFFMHIIHSLPSDTAVRDALIKEIKTGWQLQKELERKNEIVAAHQAKALKVADGKKTDFRCLAHFPSDTYHLLTRRYGREEIHSKEFLKDWQKRYPHLSPNKL